MFRGLESKVAIVTGATSGIGEAAAKRFAAEKAKVVCAGRDDVKGLQVMRKIQANGGQSVFVKTDVINAREVEDCVKQAVENYGMVDILFNNAGIVLYRTCVDMTESEWDLILDTNLKSAFLFSKYAFPSLKEHGGTIINNASEVVSKGAASLSAYCASKGGMVSFTKSMALECAPFRVRVNCICPGSTRSRMLDTDVEFFAEKEKDDPKGKTVALRSILEMIPVRRVARPEEIAAVVAFLASDEASYMTGAIISVDGGTTAK